MPEEGLLCGTQTLTRSEAYFAVLGHETIHYAAFRIMPRRSAFLGTGAWTKHSMSA
jgi:hypothetical protein